MNTWMLISLIALLGAAGGFGNLFHTGEFHLPKLDADANVWCLGPEAMGRALTTAQAPELVLPDYQRTPFRLSSLRGQKVLIVTWSSW